MTDGLATWISLAALIVSCVIGALGYLRRSPFVSATVAEALREEIEDLRRRRADDQAEIVRLRGALRDALDRAEWWQDQYRKSQQSDPR